MNRIEYINIDIYIIEKLNKFYKYYQFYIKSSKRFKFIIKNDIEFNYSIILNIFYINRNPVLYIINKAIIYNTIVFIQDIFTKTI